MCYAQSHSDDCHGYAVLYTCHSLTCLATMSCVHVMLVKASLNWPHTRCGVTCIEESPLSLLHYELQDILCSPSQLLCCCHRCCSALAFCSLCLSKFHALPLQSFVHCPFKVSCTGPSKFHALSHYLKGMKCLEWYTHDQHSAPVCPISITEYQNSWQKVSVFMTITHRKWTHKRYVWRTVYKWAWRSCGGGGLSLLTNMGLKKFLEGSNS